MFGELVADGPRAVRLDSARSSDIAHVIGRFGFAQCHPHKDRSILGQLVRLSTNDPSPTPNRRSTIGPSIGRFPSITEVTGGFHGKKGIDRCEGSRVCALFWIRTRC